MSLIRAVSNDLGWVHSRTAQKIWNAVLRGDSLVPAVLRGRSCEVSEQVLELLPVWAFFAAACLLAGLSLEFGYWFGQRRRSSEAPSGEPSIGVIVGSILALWAFIFAFTFNMAASRYEQRREAVLEDANAIGTAYTASAVLPQSARAHTKDLFRQYVSLRLKVVQPNASFEQIKNYIQKSENILNEIWDSVAQTTVDDRSIMTGYFLHSLDNVMSLHGKRVALGLRGSIPLPIWFALCTVGALGLASAGYQAGLHPPRRIFLSLVLVLDFAAVLTIIADLDNPRAGFLVSMQSPMIDLAKSIEAR